MRLILAIIILPVLAFAQKGRPQRIVVCSGGGSASAATCTPSPALAALSDLSTTPRTLVSFTPTANSTGAITLAINGLTATAIRKYVGGAAQAIAADDLRASTSYLLEYDGTYFIVKSVLGNGGGGGSGDVTSASSITDNRIVRGDGGSKGVQQSGCTIDDSNNLTCPGSIATGDGSTTGYLEGLKGTAPGSPATDKYRLYWDASGVLSDKDSSGTVRTYTSGGGGGGGTMTAGYCYMTTGCTPPQAGLASQTPAATINRVYVLQVVFPYSMTISQLTAFAAGGGGSGDGMVLGAFLDSSNTPGNRIAGCAFTDTSVGGAVKTCSATIPVTAGTPIWFALAAENTAMSLRGFVGQFGAGLADHLASINRIGWCANAPSGTGSGLTLPTSCGSLTTLAWAFPAVVGRP